MEDKLSTLVPDIYSMLDKLNHEEGITESLEPFLDDFVASVKETVLQWSVPQVRPKGKNLRMSSVGRKDRQLWYDNNIESTSIEVPYTQLKFLYGHLIEEVLLLFCRAAGHTVTDEQREVVVEGVKGHMDAVIDGEVVDVKSAAPYSFTNKFKLEKLPEDDPFGYLAQLAGYEEDNGTEKGGFLVADKVSGELVLYRPDDIDKPEIVSRIKYLKGMIDIDTPPAMCYLDTPEGKKGNMVINKNCVYCKHKEICKADTNNGKGLRKFKYSNGVKYFTVVESLPKVEEIV